MKATVIRTADWREPLQVLRGCAEDPFSVAFLSDGGERGRWSYVLAEPEAVFVIGPDDRRDVFRLMAEALGPATPGDPGGPPFQGGIAGLMSYELGARVEPVGHPSHPEWPLAAFGVYPALLAFDHHRRRVLAVGRGADEAQAAARADAMLARLAGAQERAEAEGVLAESFDPAPPDAGEIYERSVAAVVGRIAAGEIFQANAARAWTGRLKPGVAPIDVCERLYGSSPAPFAAYFRLPGRAVVSNSPERFVKISREGELLVETRPIKGTRPRGATPAEDEALKAELVACEKDRAENLMIVDLMRNDLARVAPAGSVKVTELFVVESYPNVHHLVSTVTSRLAAGLGPADLFEAAFPPGSITGAPKIQAIKVIADYEGPRGPYCGSMFWAGFDGACDSSVLIRTIGFLEEAGGGWRFEARAGAGLVADSDPVLERLETEAKIDAIRRALTRPAP